MRKLITATLLNFLLAVACFGQGGSAATPTLKVSDGVKSFNGVNELRVPAGCVTFSGRTAVINCTAGGSGGATSSQNGNLFFASPNGAYGLPSWRAILEADLPSINASKIGSGTIATARLGSGTASSSTYLRGDSTWATFTSGTVTSVALSLPAEFSVSGSPVTTAGTLAGAWATQTANKFFGAPEGSTGTPAFRTLAEADIPALAQSKVTGLVSDLAAKASTAALSAHTSDTANPHAVTKTQVGLSAVSNDAQLKIGSNLSDLNNASTARTNLGVAIGTNVQAADATLTALAAHNTNGLLTQTAADTFTGRTITGTTNQVTVTNGNGVGGNPTLSLPQSINTGAAVQFGTLGLNTSTPSTLNGSTFASTLGQVYNASNSAYFSINTALSGGYAGVLLNRGGASANNRLWAFEAQPDLAATGSQFGISTYTDAGTPTSVFTITRAGSVIAGAQAALATTATSGFLYVPTTAGTPTGVPTAVAGKVPIVIDTTNDKLCYYISSWRCF